MDANFKNRTLFHGDNLPVLRGINSDCIDLIATDPPFNKSKDFHATPDTLAKGAKFQDRWSWERDVHQDWLDQIKDDWPAVWEVIDAANAVYMRKTKKNLKEDRDKVGSDMGAFLCFMAVRLLAMRRILKPTGTLYLHCDPTASHYLKALLDAIFGKENFRNEVIWAYRKWTNAGQMFQFNHDVLLAYGKSKSVTFNKLFDADAPQAKKYERGWDVNRVGTGIRQLIVYDRQKAQHKIDAGKYDRLVMRDSDEQKQVALPDWWEIPIINSQAKERTGYPTQKPLKLYERIIQASSNEGDIVLDPFAGCATTCVAAEHLERQWAGIDIWEKAHEVVVDRLHEEVGLFGEVNYTKDVPVRTDDGETAAPDLQVRLAVKEPEGPRMSRAEMYEILLSHQGIKCQGCDRTFDDPRYLELDHNTPRSQRGRNDISNRILLCGPCNRLKSDVYTLKGLRNENKKRGYMRGQHG